MLNSIPIIIRRLVTATYMAALAYVSLRPGLSSGEGEPLRGVIDNFLHVPAYAILTLFLLCSINININKYKKVFVIAFVFGVLMEIGQSFVPNRYMSLMDVGLNSIGIVFALYFYSKVVVKETSL